MKMNQNKVTGIVTYDLPIGAVLDGVGLVQVNAIGDQDGSSTVFQYCNPTTGKFEWAPQNKFTALDGRFPITREALSHAIDQLKGSTIGNRQ